MNSHRACLVAALLAPVVGCGDNIAPANPPEVDAGSEPTKPDAPLPVPAVGITFFDFSIAVDISPDGRYAVFEDISTEEGTLHIHDTILGTVTETADLGNPARSLATGISSTGRISAMRNEPVEASLWSKTAGWLNLGSPHATGCGAEETSGAFDISADGHVAVGLAWNGCTAAAFRWSDAGGTGAFTPLQVIGTGSAESSNPPHNRATVVSDDGTVAGGFAQNGAVDRSPAIWTASGSGILLDPTNTEVAGEVMSISANGGTIAGQTGNDGFIWTATTGMAPLVRFDLALGSDPVFPNAMSADGTLVFGGVGSSFFSIPTAFVWSAEDGMRSIAELAVAAGIALPAGMTLNSILGVSADGTVLIGSAMDADLALKTFTLRLPPTAY